MSRNNWLLVFGLVVVGLSLFGSGFWVGNKLKNVDASSTSSSPLIIEKKVDAVSVPGVYWIKAGESPVCPETHPIKGKFDNYTGYFYAIDYKTYDKIKPMLCFASEEYASKQAGFLKKY